MINRQLLLIMGIALLIVLPVVLSLIERKDRSDRMKKNVGSSLAKRSGKDLTLVIYRYLNKIELTRSYVDRISRYYEILYPGDAEDMARKTVNTTILTWLFCFIAVGLVFLKGMDFNNTAVSILLVYVINAEVISYRMTNTELKLLEDMALFLSNVRHNFYINRMVDDAILLSIRDIKSYEMRVHANKLYEIVTASNVKEAVMNYNTTMHNRYLKMFLSLCINVMEYNDKTINGQNLFALNLDNLKKEIETENIKQRRIRFKFSGITFVTIAVCVPIDEIRKYGISMVPELEAFYNGRGGIIYAAATLLTAFGIYLLNNQLKETRRQLPGNYTYLKRLERIGAVKKILDNYEEKHEKKMYEIKDILKRIGESISPRQLLLKRMIFSAGVCLASILFVIYLHEVNQKNILYSVNSLPDGIMSVNAASAKAIRETIISYVGIYKNKEVINQEELLNRLTEEGTFYNSSVNEAIAQEVINRVELYHEEYFSWYELLSCIAASIIAYFIPFWMLLYKKKVLQLNMEDEVNQLNSIIYMLMYSDHITVKELLEEMELFAEVFRQTIQECINDYSSGDIEALEQMKEKEAFGPFIRLTDNLIRCDSIAIYKAFDEIASDRENYHERRKLENEISVQKRADRAQFISWIPAVLIIVYLIIPLLVTSLEALNTFKEMMQSV